MFRKLTIIAATFFAFNANAQEQPEPSTQEFKTRFNIAVMEWVPPENNPDNKTEKFFIYEGGIGSTSAQELAIALKKYPGVKKIALNSPGGLASEASKIGSLFSDNKIRVWVPKGRACLSACANAFIGGHDYKISGILGFHTAWVPNSALAYFPPEKLNVLYSRGQYQGVFDAYYWMVNGFNIQLAGYINGGTNPTKFLVFKHEDELMKYYVRDDTEGAVNDVHNYIRWNKELKPVYMQNREITQYMIQQYKELSNDGVPVKLIEVLYTPKKQEGQEDVEEER